MQIMLGTDGENQNTILLRRGVYGAGTMFSRMASYV